MSCIIKYANMHLHSTHSDGQFSPYQLVLLAKSLGYGGIVLSDHDVISGVPELLRVAEKAGLESMSGVELSCKEWGVGFHILGYDFDTNDYDLAAFIKRLCRLRNDHTRMLLEAGLERGTIKDITWQEVLDYNPGNEWFCNEQVCRAMMAKGIVKKEDWGRINDLNFSYKAYTYYSLPIETVSAEEAIYRIRKAGGISVLAHPAGQSEYVDRLVELGLQGVETCHPEVDIQEQQMLSEKADRDKLYNTGGTDHFGPMGGCMGEYAVPAFHGASKDAFRAIKERRFG